MQVARIGDTLRSPGYPVVQVTGTGAATELAEATDVGATMLAAWQAAPRELDALAAVPRQALAALFVVVAARNAGQAPPQWASDLVGEAAQRIMGARRG